MALFDQISEDIKSAMKARLVLQLRIVELAVNQNLDVLALPVRQDGFIPRPEQRAHRHRNGHPVIQQRPVHRLLQYESIIVIHQSYISFFILLFTSYGLLTVFLGSSYPLLILTKDLTWFLEPLPKVSVCSQLGLSYAYVTPFQRPCRDSATLFILTPEKGDIVCTLSQRVLLGLLPVDLQSLIYTQGLVGKSSYTTC